MKEVWPELGQYAHLLWSSATSSGKISYITPLNTVNCSPLLYHLLCWFFSCVVGVCPIWIKKQSSRELCLKLNPIFLQNLLCFQVVLLFFKHTVQSHCLDLFILPDKALILPHYKMDFLSCFVTQKLNNNVQLTLSISRYPVCPISLDINIMCQGQVMFQQLFNKTYNRWRT